MFHSSFVGQKEELSNLKSSYAGLSNILKKIDSLCENFRYMRRVAGDGNCFYRSFSFGYFEYVLENRQECIIFKRHLQKIKDGLISLRFNELRVTNMHNKVNFNLFYKVLLTCSDVIMGGDLGVVSPHMKVFFYLQTAFI